MKRIVRTLCTILLAASVLVSCDPGPAGIFSLLEEEEPLNKGTDILNTNTASFVLAFGGDYYTAVASTLLRRPVGGGSWEKVTVTGAPEPGEGENYVISSGVTDGTYLYIAYSPVNGTIMRWDTSDNPASWISYGDLDKNDATGEPVQSLLMASNDQLFAATSPDSTGSSSSSYTNYYSIYYDTGSGAFASAGVTGVACGLPASIAYDGANYWITAGKTIFTGAAGSLAADGGVPTSYINDTEPVFSVYYDGARVIAAGTGYLFNLSDSYARSSVFGSDERRLSSLVEVPANGGATNVVVVGVKPWGSDDYLGYYEYDADLNTTFGSGVTPDTAYTMITSNSNYVTTLDDEGIEGFYYDSTGYTDSDTGHACTKLFARTVRGGLWSNTWDTVDQEWSGWDRE